MKRTWAVLAVLVLAIGCATLNTDEDKISPEFGRTRPQTIVVLPPTNYTVDLDAPGVFRTTVQKKIERKGYRSPTPEQVDAVLQEEGITDPGQLPVFTPREIGELFEADAVLYTEVTEWKTTYLVVYSVVGVGARFELIDTQSEQTLWKSEKALRTRMIAWDGTGWNRETIAGSVIRGAVLTAGLALIPYAPFVDELVDNAFASLPAR